MDILKDQLKKTIRYIIHEKSLQIETAKKSFEKELNVGDEYKFVNYKIDNDGKIFVTFIDSLGNIKILPAPNSVLKVIEQYEFNKKEYEKIISIFDIIATLAYYSDMLNYKELNKFLTN